MDPNIPRHPHRLHAFLLGAYLLALVYGTLYPWTGWRSKGLSGFSFLFEAWPRYWTWFDLVVNVLIYAPLGLLLAVSMRKRFTQRGAVLTAIALASGTSLMLEGLQSFLPGRVPSRADWFANSAGAALGALAARSHAWLPRLERNAWQRQGMPLAESAAGLALLTAWLAIQMHPQRLLFGNGDLIEAGLRALATAFGPLSETGITALGPQRAGTLESMARSVRVSHEYIVQIEAFGTTAAVVAIGLIVREIWPARAPRVAITVGLVALAMALRSASAALLLGSAQAFTWLSAGAQGGLVTGAVALTMLSSGRRRARLRLAIAALVLTALLTSVFPPDAYNDSMMQRWDRGAWRNFNGLLEALAMLWPLAGCLWCAARLKALRRADTTTMESIR